MKQSFAIKMLLVATSSALVLGACGGGGGAGPTATNGGAENGSGNPAQASRVTGKAIDGYLSNAKVCLDLNENDVCDADEPSAVTDADGNYQLDYAGPVVGKRLLVQVTSATRDQSRPGYTFPANFVLTSVVTSTANQHITPLTTMVAAQMASGLDRWHAEQRVGQLFGVDANVTGDYIAGNNPATATVAMQLVDKIGQLARNGNVDAATTRAVMNAVVAKGGIAAVTQDDVDQQLRRPTYSTHVDPVSILATGNLYSDGDSVTVGGQSIQLRDRWQYVGGLLRVTQQKYLNAQWVDAAPGEFEQNYGEYVVKPDGSWSAFISQAAEETPYQIQSTTGNVQQAVEPGTGIASTLEYRQADVSGKTVGDALLGWLDLPPGIPVLAQILPAGATFYSVRATQNNDRVSVASFSSCGTGPRVTEDGVSHCNFIGDPAVVHTSVDDIFNFDVPGSSGGRLRLTADGKGHVLDSTGRVLDSGTVSWSRYAANRNVLVLKMTVQDAAYWTGAISANIGFSTKIAMGGSVVIALHNGRLKLGELTPAQTQRSALLLQPSLYDLYYQAVMQMGLPPV